MVLGKNRFLVFLAAVLSSSLPSCDSIQPCTLCKDGSSTPVPDKIAVIPNLPPASCKQLELAVPFAIPNESSEQCHLAHQLSSLCGCPVPEDACHLCPDGSRVTNQELELPMFTPIFENAPFTCILMEAYLQSFSNSSDFCPHVQRSAAELCGCPESSFNFTSVQDEFSPQADLPIVDWKSFRFGFFGADGAHEENRLFLVLRVSAFMSIVGALITIQDNVRNKNRFRNQYNQIATLMAGFDIIYSIAVALAQIPRPVDDILQAEGVRGTNVTCKAQGFFIQWGGLTSLFLNVSLATYYMLIILHQTRESQLRRLRKYLLGLPILAGTVLALASLPFITPCFNGCHIPPPTSTLLKELEIADFSSSWGPYLCLYIIPGYLVITYTTVVMLRVYLRVRRINRASSRWTFQNQESKSSQSATNRPALLRQRQRTSIVHFQSEVAWQSAFYLVALYLTWFVTLIVALVAGSILTSHYRFWTFIFFMTPLQGFLNSLVYLRPRLSRLAAKKWGEHLRRRQLTSLRKKGAAKGVSEAADQNWSSAMIYATESPENPVCSSRHRGHISADSLEEAALKEEEEDIHFG